MFLVDSKTIGLKIMISKEDPKSNPWLMAHICKPDENPESYLATPDSEILHLFDISIDQGQEYEALMGLNGLLENTIKNMFAQFFMKGFEKGLKIAQLQK